MTTAQQVAQATRGATAYTLGGGYATFYDTIKQQHSRVLFEAAALSEVRRNEGGRCTHCIATYKDGSRLKFTYSNGAGSRLRIL